MDEDITGYPPIWLMGLVVALTAIDTLVLCFFGVIPLP